MNQKQAIRPQTHATPSCGGDDDANAKLEAARAEGASVYSISKAHLEKAKKIDSSAYLEQGRQRSGQ
ncbi:MAG: hypothetical protein ABMA13_02340 [Chthoniobacteraceae bacterium]